MKFYQLALDRQSQKLDGQIEEIIQSLSWNRKTWTGKVKITDLYKQVDADTLALKKQLKGEKERLKYMKKVSGVEMLMEHGIL